MPDTLADQLRARLQERKAPPAKEDAAEETPEQREARLMDDPDVWTGCKLGNNGSILPR